MQTVKNQYASDEEQVFIHVRDYGNGIPEDKIEHIFDAMPSAPSSASDTRKGMGIGLSICKAIIRAHSGTIQVQPHPDGTEFYFTLPKEDMHFE